MTYKEFIDKIQEYYGSYPKESKIGGYVLSYLKRDIDEEKLDRLFRYLTYAFPHRFGSPGIADIEKAITEAIKNHKGEDVHKIKTFTTSEEEYTIDDKEYEEGKKLLEEAGGLSGIFNGIIQEKNVRNRWD